MVTRPTVDEVERGYHGNPVDTGDLASSGDFNAPDEAEQAILEAVSMFDAVLSDRVLLQNETADADMAIRLLCRHKWSLILGGAQSEGQGGANVTWTLPDGSEVQMAPSRYAKELQAYMAGQTPNVGVFRTGD